jgi:opacity protein-like surface antigen
MKTISPLVAAMSLATALGLCAAAPAGAQSKTTDSGWQFEATPYLWLTSLKGTSQIGNTPELNVNLSTSDVLDALDSALMGAFEARKDRWGMFFDLVYAKLSFSGGKSGSLHGGPGVDVNADIDVKNTIASGAVLYRAIEGRTPVDLFLGARYNDVDIDANVSANFFGVLGITRSPNYSKSWWDPYIGARVTHPVAEHWTLVGYADYGGFGVGSDNTWQALAGVKYDFNKTFSANLGYRYLHIDYDKDGFKFDMDYAGAYLGLGIKF